jgi:hypothetical protein
LAGVAAGPSDSLLALSKRVLESLGWRFLRGLGART